MEKRVKQKHSENLPFVAKRLFEGWSGHMFCTELSSLGKKTQEQKL